MSTYNIEIETDNALVIARILEQLSADLEQGRPATRALFDADGTRIGTAYFTD